MAIEAKISVEELMMLLGEKDIEIFLLKNQIIMLNARLKELEAAKAHEPQQ